VPAALAVLGAPTGPAAALVATAPFGLAWAVVGYDTLARRELSVRPTRVTPRRGD